MNCNRTSSQVGRGGDQAVAHVRLHTLGAFADRLGLGDGFVGADPSAGERVRTCWHPAVRQDGEDRPGAAVAELTRRVSGKPGRFTPDGSGLRWC